MLQSETGVSGDFGIGVMGVGRYVPKRKITNDQVAEWTGISVEDILEKTGIESRYAIEKDDTASSMAAHACQDALKSADIEPEQVGLIVGCTSTADYLYPAMACKVHQILDTKNAYAFDLLANCTGFQIGLSTASAYLTCHPDLEFALVFGAAVQSPYVKWDDPNDAMFFGDGAGAAVIGRVPSGYGILSDEIITQSASYDAVRLRGGGSSFPLREDNISDGLQYYDMSGLEVWKQVIQFQPRTIRRSLEKIGKTVDDADFFVVHQANLRLIEYLMAKMKQPLSKTFTNVAQIGNTADASLAITLCDSVHRNLIKRDDLVVLSGVGAGFTFGSSVLRWY